MKVADCFEKVEFMHKGAFFVAGLEVDINYAAEGGLKSIETVWAQLPRWEIPDRTDPEIIYGMTHSETAEDTGKYIGCVEVTTLDNLPVGLVGRRFAACDYAVFDTTLEIIQSGEFWRTFYAKWLPASGYDVPDEPLHENYTTFNRFPAIEVYGANFAATHEIKIFAPVAKKE